MGLADDFFLSNLIWKETMSTNFGPPTFRIHLLKVLKSG